MSNAMIALHQPAQWLFAVACLIVGSGCASNRIALDTDFPVPLVAPSSAPVARSSYSPRNFKALCAKKVIAKREDYSINVGAVQKGSLIVWPERLQCSHLYRHDRGHDLRRLISAQHRRTAIRNACPVSYRLLRVWMRSSSTRTRRMMMLEWSRARRSRWMNMMWALRNLPRPARPVWGLYAQQWLVDFSAAMANWYCCSTAFLINDERARRSQKPRC